MLTTNFVKIKGEPGSAEIYKKLAEALGGVSRYGQNTLITIDIIVESIGLADAIWAMRCVNEPPFNLLLEFACRCAEHALPVFEAKYPEDKRVRSAITAARKYFVTPASDYPKYEADTTHSAHSATHAAYYAFAEHETKAAFAAWTAQIAADIAADNAHGFQYKADAAHVAQMASNAAYSAYTNRPIDDTELKWQTDALLEMLRK
jgi:hypothetical protein